MSRDYFEHFGSEENRSAFVARELDRLVVLPPPPEQYGPPTPNHVLFPDDFLMTEFGWPISKALAKQIGYREEPARWDAGDGGQRPD